MYITSDFDKHIVFSNVCILLVNQQWKEIRIKYMKKKKLIKCCFLEALLFLWVQYVESAFTLKLTIRNSDDANGDSQINMKQVLL